MITGEGAEFLDGLRKLNEAYALGLGETAFHVCHQHFQVLRKWNRVMNLVGDLTLESAIHRHYGESLFLATRMQPNWTRVADFGAGAGFPGIGIGAALPHTKVDLLEIRRKRVAFLKEATRGCPNIHVEAGAAEKYEQTLDAVTGRAVDIGSILRFADKRGIACCLLVGEADAERWVSQISHEHDRCEIMGVPWRPRSVVMSIHPIPARG